MGDLAYAMRTLRKTPGFTAIALLVFAIGIGAATAMLSVADVLLLRPLPVPQVERVMTVWQYDREAGTSRQDVASGNALDWMNRTQSFESIAMAEPWRVTLTSEGREPELLAAARVSERFFAVLGTPMLYGRPFLPQEYQPGAARAAIFSHAMWRDRYGGDASIIGQQVRFDEGGLEGVSRGVNTFTVVGVLPPGFELQLFANRSAQREPFVWLPKPGFESFEPNIRARGFWNIVGRLAPGVSIEQAKAEFDALSAQLARDYPQTNKSVGAQIVPLRDHLGGSLRGVLPLLVGAAAILLIVACANVANLVLARGIGRARELAVRHALGASRGRLARQMLTECVLLAALGGAAGLVFARWALDALVRLRPHDVARLDAIPIDARAAIIVCGVTIVAAMIAGLAPSMQLSRSATDSVLREWRTTSHGSARGALVIVEVAAALVLAVGASLLARSFILIQRLDPGFRADDVAVLQIFVNPGQTPQRRMLFFQQALDRIRALPGVIAAGAVSAMPFGEARVEVRLAVTIVGGARTTTEPPLMYTTVVGGDYFRAMGVPLLAGRLFDTTDTASSQPVVLLSRRAVEEFWPGANPVGSRVQFRFMGNTYPAEVIGVVGDVRHDGLERPGRAELFLPHAQSSVGSMTIVVRMAPESPTTMQTLKEQIWVLDPAQPFYSTTTLDLLISRTLGGRRLSLLLLGGFALATLLLMSAGVYGVISFSTTQRTREFGVRLALGAARRDIVRLVLRDGMMLAAIGVSVGIVLALPLAQLLRALLFGVTATDPLAFVVVAFGLFLIVAAACCVPARRALTVDPVQSLRIE